MVTERHRSLAGQIIGEQEVLQDMEPLPFDPVAARKRQVELLAQYLASGDPRRVTISRATLTVYDSHGAPVYIALTPTYEGSENIAVHDNTFARHKRRWWWPFGLIALALIACTPVQAQEPEHLCNGKMATIYAVSHTGVPRTGPVEVLGTDGDDVIVVDGDGVPPSDKAWVWGASGNDTICINTDDAVVWGGPGDDWISGGPSEDWLKGQKGSDVIFGNGGHDVIWGGGERDELHGGRGNDQMKGDEGRDTVFGDAGHDQITGDREVDQIDCGEGEDYASGDGGRDDTDYPDVITNCEAVLQ